MQKNEESNQLGKMRDLFKKIRNIKGTLHAKMSTIKDRNGMDHYGPIAEMVWKILRRGGKNT